MAEQEFSEELLSKIEEIVQRTVETTINSLAARGKRMPGSGGTGQVTEIIIRCGYPEAVQILGTGTGTPCVITCPPSGLSLSIPGLQPSGDVHLEPASQKLFDEIRKKTLDDAKGLARKLGERIASRYLAEAIRDFAAGLDIETPAEEEE